MIRNVDVPLKDLAGAPLYAALDLQQLLAATAKLTDEQRAALAAAINATGRAEMTLKAAIVNALQAMFEDERALDGEEKLKRWQLAMRVYLGGDVDLSSEEIAKIKKLVGKLYGPSVVGPVWTALEGEKPKAVSESTNS